MPHFYRRAVDALQCVKGANGVEVQVQVVTTDVLALHVPPEDIQKALDADPAVLAKGVAEWTLHGWKVDIELIPPDQGAAGADQWAKVAHPDAWRVHAGPCSEAPHPLRPEDFQHGLKAIGEFKRLCESGKTDNYGEAFFDINDQLRCGAKRGAGNTCHCYVELRKDNRCCRAVMSWRGLLTILGTLVADRFDDSAAIVFSVDEMIRHYDPD